MIKPFRIAIPQADLDDLTDRLARTHAAERRYDIRHWSEFERGGHFAAMEVPELLAGDVRDFFLTLLDKTLLDKRLLDKRLLDKPESRVPDA